MTEDEARRFLLVRAVEAEDAGEVVLTREDRQQASVAAGEAAASDGGRRDGDEAFLVRRSDFAAGRIATRFPAAAAALRSARWPTWLGWLVPAGALLIGVLTNEIDNGRRLNLVAFPLLGMLGWNLAVYALLAAGALRRLTGARAPARPGLFARLADPARRQLDRHSPLGRGLVRLGRDWLERSAPLSYSRTGRTLHLAAPALAAGVLLGLYGRALARE